MSADEVHPEMLVMERLTQMISQKLTGVTVAFISHGVNDCMLQVREPTISQLFLYIKNSALKVATSYITVGHHWYAHEIEEEELLDELDEDSLMYQPEVPDEKTFYIQVLDLDGHREVCIVEALGMRPTDKKLLTMMLIKFAEKNHERTRLLRRGLHINPDESPDVTFINAHRSS